MSFSHFMMKDFLPKKLIDLGITFNVNLKVLQSVASL